VNRNISRHGGRTRRGQALIEMTVALVAILAILAALLQIGLLSRVHLDTIGEARGNAAQYAISDTYQSMQPSADMIQSWSEGDDGRRYSRDDAVALGSGQFLRQSVIPVSRPAELQRLVPGNRFFSLQNNDPVAEEFEFVRGTAESRPVPLLPVVRHLLYNAETIRLEAQAVTVWTKGID
jgi:hypothetical protein